MITLVRPPVISSKKSFSAPITPPLALAYLAGSLEASGYKVSAIDGTGLDIDSFHKVPGEVYAYQGLGLNEIIARVPHDSSLIAVTCMFSLEWVFVKELLDQLHEKFPDIPIVVGGEHVTAVWDYVIEECPYLAACVLGEGEEAIVDLAHCFVDKKLMLNEVTGIVYLDENNQLQKNPDRKRIIKIEDIPRPAWHLFPIEAYLEGGYGHGVNRGRTMPILATRGCPYTCTFCSNPTMWTTRYVTRPPSDVLDEMEDYIKEYKAEHFDFYDLTAIVRKQWFMEFGQELKRRNLNISYSLPSGTRSEALDDEVTSLMAETKCNYLVYAPESGSDRMLKLIKKKIDLEKMLNSIRSAKKNGMEIRCNLMMGFPDELRSDVLKTLFFQMRLAWIGVDDAPIYMFSPYPGSQIFKELRESNPAFTLNKQYFEGLICQMDLMEGNNCPTLLNKKELIMWRILGMMLFYTLSYLFYPKRILRSYHNIFVSRLTSTVFEQRIVEALRKRGFMKKSMSEG